MNYLLMHKNIPVTEVEIDEVTGNITHIRETLNLPHSPLGTYDEAKGINRAALNHWWTTRSIPANRNGVAHFLKELGLESTKLLLTKSMGLSLSDHYWVKPLNSNVKWEEVNFFSNSFSNDIGEILMGGYKASKKIDLIAPDNTSDGVQKKRWSIINGRRVLIKAGTLPFRQEPINEIVASKFMDALQIPHVAYYLGEDKEQVVSLCPCFIDEHTELVSAWNIINASSPAKEKTEYDRCAESLIIAGIPREKVIRFLDEMITIDFLIANEDRHFGNFGVIRNPETLEIIGMAPIFDNGASFGYKRVAWDIINDKDDSCKPFDTSHYNELNLVSRKYLESIVGINKLSPIAEEYFTGNNNITNERADAIIDALSKRIHHLEKRIEQAATKDLPLIKKSEKTSCK